jgi:acetamidase/formamidase
MTVHRIVPSVYYYTFAPHPPAVRIASGDTVVAETRDAMGFDTGRNPLPVSMKQPAPGTALQQSNPVVGPVYVENAVRGDLLAIRIERIRMNRDFALSKQTAHFGSLTGETPGHMLLYNPPIETQWTEWRLDLERNVGIVELPNSRLRRAEVPLHPFLGSIGVAPRFGRVESTLTPGEYGGNMDCVDTHEGTTLYLPVWVDGGYLSFGDVHAAQGDGELNGTALEVTAEVTLCIDVLKGRQAQWPRIEDETHIMVAGSTRPLMDCLRIAQVELLNWLVVDYGFQREEAWQLNAQVGTMRIGNVVDPNYTVVAKFPKRYLP